MTTTTQATLFEIDQTEIAPQLPLDERYRLWIARQSGIYYEVCEEILREIAGGRAPVSIRSVFEVLRDQPDIAKSFTPKSGFDMEFAGPMAAMLVGFGDVLAENVMEGNE